MSSSPMYTTHGRPKWAHAVAVATPCCPAPVSAITRVLFIRSVSRAWPSVLLILWAPVWLRSSRLSQIWAPPICSLSRRAWYSGDGRPTKCLQQVVELGLKRRVGPRLGVLGVELVEGVDQRLGHIPPAEVAEPPCVVGPRAAALASCIAGGYIDTHSWPFLLR